MSNTLERRYWSRIFDRVYLEKIKTAWDYPWIASVWYQGGLTATPNCNLVSNIGFGEDGSHTKEGDSEAMAMAVECLGELTHPKIVAQHEDADNYAFQNHFGGKYLGVSGFPRRVTKKLYSLLKIAS